MCHLILFIAVSDPEHKADLKGPLSGSLQVCHFTYRETGAQRGEGTWPRPHGELVIEPEQEEYNPQLQYTARQVFPKFYKYH